MISLDSIYRRTLLLIASFAVLLSACSLAGAATLTAQAQDRTGATRINQKDGAEMVYVPAGEFSMGDDDMAVCGNPRHKVTLSGFWIYKNLVTVGEYKAFCQATGRQMPAAPVWGLHDDKPMLNMSWDDATAYASWAGVSLPSEAQWEKAARGTDGRAYPWGNKWDPTRCVHSVGRMGELGGPRPVGSCPSGASAYGVMDMAGNAWQWCADWFGFDYWSSAASQTVDPRDNIVSVIQCHVLRGGSWGNADPRYFRCASRNYDFGPSGLYFAGVGFRCAVADH